MEWRRELAEEHSGLRPYLVLGVCLRNDFLRSVPCREDAHIGLSGTVRVVLRVAVRREPQATGAPQLAVQTLAVPCTSSCCAAVLRCTPPSMLRSSPAPQTNSRTQLAFKHSSRNFPWKLSTYAFCTGRPGLMCSSSIRRRPSEATPDQRDMKLDLAPHNCLYISISNINDIPLS